MVAAVGAQCWQFQTPLSSKCGSTQPGGIGGIGVLAGQSAGISGVSDGSDALDRPGPTADLAAALLDAPRRLDPAGRPEQAWAALEAVATAYLVWEGEVPQHLPDGGLGPRLLAGATASVLERGMSGLGIVARERI